MKTKDFRQQKINVITLGCSKNIVDSEVLMGQLRAGGRDVVHESEEQEGGIVIINTCGFIENAKQESIDTILRFAKAKASGKIDRLIVTGCLSERYKPELRKEIPEVDSFFGTHDLPKLLKSIGIDYRHELIGERVLTTPSHFAYLKISEGCDRPCSFCAIPIMRGVHKSKPIEEILAETKALVKSGIKEIILIAQDSTYYGLDLYGKRVLADLLRQMSDIEGVEWIRLHYAFPSGFPEDILEVMRERDNICKYLDIPLQHINSDILKSMKRGMDGTKTRELIKRIRETVPGISLRTTLIVGYPGETEAAFQEMKSFVDKARFDRLGVFTYSHEENTSAHKLIDDVPEALKQERAAAIMLIQQEISTELNEEKIGQTLKVLIDRKEGDYFVGRTEYDSPEVDNEVLIDATNQFLRIGDFANIKITGTESFDLIGECAILPQPPPKGDKLAQHEN